MEVMDAILSLLETKPLTNVFVTGFLDQDKKYAGQRFYPMLTTVYIEFEEQLLRCSAVDHGDYLDMKIVDKIECDFDLDDDVFCISSLNDLYLNLYRKKNMVNGFLVLIDERSNLANGQVSCALLQLGDNDNLFIDPLNLFGIRLGAKEQLDHWIADRAALEVEHPRGRRYETHQWHRPFVTVSSVGSETS